jgi:sugar phosphate permease
MATLRGNGADTRLPIVLIGTVAFCLLGPYAYLGGAMALDFGGKAAAALASGIIDGVGYLGAVFAGVGGAKLAVTFGWRGLFANLAVIGAVGALGAGVLYAMERRAVAARTTAAGVSS